MRYVRFATSSQDVASLHGNVPVTLKLIDEKDFPHEGKLDFDPRTRFSYSNTGYILLGGIVEKVSGEPFGKFDTFSTMQIGRAHV